MDRKEAIAAYFEKFDEGPPIVGMEEDVAILLKEEAIKSGKKMTEGAEVDIPDEALL